MQSIDIDLTLDLPQDIDIELDGQQEADFDVNDIVEIIRGEFPFYEGPYSVTPRVAEQQLETRNTTVTQNIEVEGIPVYRTSNPYGTTVIIG